MKVNVLHIIIIIIILKRYFYFIFESWNLVYELIDEFSFVLYPRWFEAGCWSFRIMNIEDLTCKYFCPFF